MVGVSTGALFFFEPNSCLKKERCSFFFILLGVVVIAMVLGGLYLARNDRADRSKRNGRPDS